MILIALKESYVSFSDHCDKYDSQEIKLRKLTVMAPYISRIVMRNEQNAMANATELSAEITKKPDLI